MRLDVYDIDTGQWRCWDSDTGYRCDWMTIKDYVRWYGREYGVTHRKPPSRSTVYRADAEEMERRRTGGKA